MHKKDIRYPSSIFKHDKLGLLIRDMTFGNEKCVVETVKSANTQENQLRGTCDQTNNMLVLSALGQILTQLVILLEKEENTPTVQKMYV